MLHSIFVSLVLSLVTAIFTAEPAEHAEFLQIFSALSAFSAVRKIFAQLNPKEPYFRWKITVSLLRAGGQVEVKRISPV
jgi:hypothetical protein